MAAAPAVDAPRRRCGVDFDRLLSYSTPRLVRFRDKRLGACNLFLNVAIFSYIVGETV